MGQATFVVELAGGDTVVVDPWFSENALARRAVPLPFGVNELPSVAALFVSHHHVDHVDAASLRTARRAGAVVVGPRGVTRRARLSGVRDVHTLRRGRRVEVCGATVEGVYADHPLCVAPVGLLVTDVDGTTLYHSGDTRYDRRIVDDVAGRRVDVACVQIAAARYPLLGRDGMNVADAARLVAELDAGVAIPMHFHVKGKTQDPERFAEAAGPRVRVLAPGEWLGVAAP